MEVQTQRRFLEASREENFDVSHFVDMLAFKALGSYKQDRKLFDPSALRACFQRGVFDLASVRGSLGQEERNQQAACQQAELAHRQKLRKLVGDIEGVHASFNELDTRIREVAAKVSHLGDHLEGANVPREKVSEASKLVRHFCQHCGEDAVAAVPVANIDDAQLVPEAQIIQKLHGMVQELPEEAHFLAARSKIRARYSELEWRLFREFQSAHNHGKIVRMRELAGALAQFSKFDNCVDYFIEASLKDTLLRSDLFKAIEPLCEKTYELAREVFVSSADSVMVKLVQNVFQMRLSDYVSDHLTRAGEVGQEKYLRALHQLFVENETLCRALSRLHLGADLAKLSRELFAAHLGTYAMAEEKHLREKCATVLARYYHGEGHTKRHLQQGSFTDQVDFEKDVNCNSIPTVDAIDDLFADLTRDFREKVGGLHLPGSSSDEVQQDGHSAPDAMDTSRVLLSQEVAVSLVQEVADAAKRAAVLCPSVQEQGQLGGKLHECLLQYLVVEHMEYGLELALMGVPSESAATSAHQEPPIIFLEVVREANLLFHVYDGKFSECLGPLLAVSPKFHALAAQRKRDVMLRLEGRLVVGLDRCLGAVMGHVRHLLRTEQKAADFKLDEDSLENMTVTDACHSVCRYVDGVVRRIRACLDGRNVDKVLLELGLRFHRAVLEHIYSFQYTGVGGMLAICDVNAYRKAFFDAALPSQTSSAALSGGGEQHGDASHTQQTLSLVNHLFTVLISLVNLLVVQPGNLVEICSEEPLNLLSKEIRTGFVQLRADYKTIKPGLPHTLR